MKIEEIYDAVDGMERKEVLLLQQYVIKAIEHLNTEERLNRRLEKDRKLMEKLEIAVDYQLEDEDESE